jgi:hypothetical protein
MTVSFSKAQVAGLLLAARPHLVDYGLVAPTAGEVIAALGGSRSASYAARRTVEDGLPSLFRPPGRPPREAPAPVEASLSRRVVTFLMDHSGSVTGTPLRRTYADVYRLFVLDLRDAHPEVELSRFAEEVHVPLPTLKDWLRGERPQVEAPTEAAAAASVHVAHVETVLAAWNAWEGGLRAFCEHVQRDQRLPLGRQHIVDILVAHGVHAPQRRDRGPDATAMRRGFETFFPGAQWVGDGMELTVEVDGTPYTVHLELNVDVASGALVGASVRPTEDAAAVVEALQDGVATTGAPPLALTLDNKPSNHAAEVVDAIDAIDAFDPTGAKTVKLRPRPYTPTDKPHVEGAFGLFSQTAPDLCVSTDPDTLAGQLVTLVAIVWARVLNHKPRADGRGSRAAMYRDARPTPEEIDAARTRFAERLAEQEKARETRKRRQDPVARVALDEAFDRFGLDDEDGRLRAAIACWPLDAVLAGIAVFEGKRARGTLPEGVDGRYLRGIVVNLATEAESMAIADALLEERMRARDRALHGLERERGRLEEDFGEDPPELVKNYVQRATDAHRTLDRYQWLRAIADVVLDADDHQQRPLLRLAARHISATHALPAKQRNAAIRFLYAKAVPVA